MFGIGTTELLIILVVALFFIGPKKLPEVAKGLGRALGEFRRASNDLRNTIENEASLPPPNPPPNPPPAAAAAGPADADADAQAEPPGDESPL